MRDQRVASACPGFIRGEDGTPPAFQSIAGPKDDWGLKMNPLENLFKGVFEDATGESRTHNLPVISRVLLST